MPEPETNADFDRTGRALSAGIATWAGVIAVASASGLLKRMPAALAGPLIVAGIAVPTFVYSRWPKLKALARGTGISRLTVFHTWRVAGTAAFLYYGRNDALPATFVRNAAWGDLIVSVLAAATTLAPRRRVAYVVFHAVGLTDFAIALGTGLMLTIRGDERMRAIARFPLALIPFFGVGLSGSAHAIAFDLLQESPKELPRFDRGD